MNLLEDANHMSSLVSACKRLGVLAGVGALSMASFGQSGFQADGGEYPIVGLLQGDQVFPQAAISAFGGIVVWHDNATDGDGYGISARRLNRNLSGSLGVFRVNESAAGDQMMPQVAMLSGGGAAFVWQTATQSRTEVFARFLKPDGTFASGDVAVSGFVTEQQVTPVVAGLPDGNALVVWASSGQDGSMLGVFGQRFSPQGEKLGEPVLINQTTRLNQRNPAIATLANGKVVVAWVSERSRGVAHNVDESGRPDPTAGVELFDIDLFGRFIDPTGNPTSDEFKLNSEALMCANPSISASPEGFLIVWSGKPSQITTARRITDGWEIYGRSFALDGKPLRSDFKINTHSFGDQYLPKASSANGTHLVVWTSVNQDGSREGVIARIFSATADRGGAEFRANTTTASQQIHPVVTSNGNRDFLVVWTCFTGLRTSFDLLAQRYSVSQDLPTPTAPHVAALSQSRLSVTWPELAGFSGVKYDVFLDDTVTAAEVEGNQWTISGLSAGSTHSVRIAYRLADGRRSPQSDRVTGRTWGEDDNFDGLPDDWQEQFWPGGWKPAGDDSDNDGASNLAEFLAGTNPADSQSVLRTRLAGSPQGWRLEWNSQPGYVYQVQLATDGTTWVNVGVARFAAGTIDSIPVGGDQDVALYRVIRLR